MTNAAPERKLHENIGEELSGLLALGFSDHQARTIIVSAAILASNESKRIQPAKAPKVVALIDVDGDQHDLKEDGRWYNPSFGYHDRDWIERHWGPVREVIA
ncbi:hypothetical protein SEA_BAJUNIPER_57 [Microbacterium phage BAjuniper]|nr:hypothetical protein SEA_BAJUNIPER_57 [Microbacterium phage BAjuniper]